MIPIAILDNNTICPYFYTKKSYTFIINTLHLHHVENGSGTPHVLMPHIYIMREDGTP